MTTTTLEKAPNFLDKLPPKLQKLVEKFKDQIELVFEETKNMSEITFEFFKSKFGMTVTLTLFGIFFAKAQQDDTRDDNTYYYFPTNNVWTANAAAQTNFNTSTKRKDYLFEEGLVNKNSFLNNESTDHYVPKSTSQTTTLIVESGNLETDRTSLEVRVNNGDFPGLTNTGVFNVIRVFGSDRNGNALYGDDAFDRRTAGVNMETANLETKTHEEKHSFAALFGDHSNSLSGLNYTLIDTSTGDTFPASDGKTIGTVAANRLHFSTAKADTNPDHPSNGGDGFSRYHIYQDGVLSQWMIEVPVEELDTGNSNNVANLMTNNIDSGDPGYQPEKLVVDPNLEAPKPVIEIIDGKYKLTNQSVYETLGFNFDDIGNKIPARLEFYAYEVGSDVNNSNLNTDPYTLEEMVAGIPVSSYPGQNIVFKCYSEDPDALGLSSDAIVNDTTPPTAVCQDATIALDANGMATIDPMTIDNGSTDNVGIVSYTVTPDTVDCNDVGSITVTLEVADAAGNTDTCTATLTVEDNFGPTPDVSNLPDVTAQCEVTSITAPTATDNCSGIITGTTTTSFPITASTTVVWNFVDSQGNASSQNQEVIIEDTAAPENPTNFSIDTVASTTAQASSDTANDNCETEGYKFYLDTTIDNIPNGTEVGDVSVPNYEYTGLTPDTPYEMYNKAYDASGNLSEASNIENITTTLGVEDFELSNSAVYPNPAENVLHIKSDAAIKSVEILNILGQKVQNITVTRSLADTPLNIDTSRYPSGTYLVKLTSDKGTVTKRVIKD